MGGRFNLGYVQVTLVFTDEVSEDDAKQWVEQIKTALEESTEVLEVLLDAYGNKDVEV